MKIFHELSTSIVVHTNDMMLSDGNFLHLLISVVHLGRLREKASRFKVEGLLTFSR